MGALGHLKYCVEIEVDFLQDQLLSNQNFLRENKINGLVVYQKKDKEFLNWYNKNKKAIQGMV